MSSSQGTVVQDNGTLMSHPMVSDYRRQRLEYASRKRQENQETQQPETPSTPQADEDDNDNDDAESTGANETQHTS